MSIATSNTNRASEEKAQYIRKSERLTDLVKRRDSLHKHIPTGAGSYKLGDPLPYKWREARDVQKEIDTYRKKR